MSKEQLPKADNGTHVVYYRHWYMTKTGIKRVSTWMGASWEDYLPASARAVSILLETEKRIYFVSSAGTVRRTQ